MRKPWLNWILSSVSCIIFCYVGYHLGIRYQQRENFNRNLLRTQCQENPDFSLVVTVYNIKAGTVTCEYQGKRYNEPSRYSQKKALPASK